MKIGTGQLAITAAHYNRNIEKSQEHFFEVMPTGLALVIPTEGGLIAKTVCRRKKANRVKGRFS